VRYRLRTLGQLSLCPDDPDASSVLSDSKSLALLAYVAAAPGRRARRSHLADLLWPHSDPGHARSSLRQAIYYLSQKAEDGLTLSDEGVVAPNPRKLRVDLWRFEEALEEEDWERAVGLYEGPFLGDYSVEGAREFEGWSEAQNERIWSGLKVAYYRIVDEATEAGDFERAIRHARAYVELNPLDETAQRTLIRTQMAAGDRVEAYRSYERYRALLREELGTEPGEELEARVERLRSQLFRAPVVESPAGPRAGSGPGEVDESDGASAREPDGAGAGTGGTGGAPERLLPAGGLRPAVVAASVGIGVVLGALAGSALTVAMGAGSGGESAAGDRTWTAAEGRLLARGGRGELREIEVHEGHARVRPTDTQWKTYRSPDGGRRLIVVRSPDGAHVAVTDTRTGDTLRMLADGEPDEVPMGWGPAGRRALYWESQRVRQDRGFVRHLRIADVETGRTRPVEGAPDLGSPFQATWSPLGPWIAFRGEDGAGEADIYLTRADGSGVRRLTPDPGEERAPAWSPDGRRLAYVSLDGEDGDGDLRVVGVDGEGREELTHGSADDRSPVWLSSRHLAFLSDREGGTDVWLMDLQTRELRRLTSRGDYRDLRPVEVPARSGPVQRVEITPRPDTVAPGQRLQLGVRAWTADGGSVPADLLPLGWSTTSPSVARIIDEATARVEGVGAASLVADAGGWTADTLRVRSRQLASRSAELAIREQWAEFPDPDRWIVFGTPEPYVTGGEGAAPAFVNNGDANYGSGVVSRDGLRLEGGRTVEFRASLPFTGRHYQSVEVGLSPSTPENGVEAWSGPDGRRISVKFSGRPGGARAGISTPEGRWRVPLPSAPEAWHRYALQIEADGRISYVVDGRLMWRSPEPAVGRLLGRQVHLLVAGRSLHTEMKVGEVSVWRAERYVFDPTPDVAGGDVGGAGAADDGARIER
jgi:DNA-binding SARP family transcriptional activator